MPPIGINQLVSRMIALRSRGINLTLLAVCPNSDSVLEAAVKAAAANDMPMLFAATLNQVDRDGGYTGWTAGAFVARMNELAETYRCTSPLYPCLDHGGPWLKDSHTRDGLTLAETMGEVRESLTACLKAGYTLLHIDPTVDRTLSDGQPIPISSVVERTVELISYAERERRRLALPPVSYEVGTEEVHGGLVDLSSFDYFLGGLRDGLASRGLTSAWPCFIVAKVGTDLHTTTFAPAIATDLYQRVAPLGSLIKGHYTDWVENPAGYPATGMGGANVGPEFTAIELAALQDLCRREVLQTMVETPSNFLETLKMAVIESGRWRKWLLPEEGGRDFGELSPPRQEWLVATGARYVWADARVLAARRQLYANLRLDSLDPATFVVDRIAAGIQKYVDAFNLHGSLRLLAG